MTSSDFSLTRLRDASTFVTLFEQYEPRASHAVGVAMEHGLDRRTCRGVLIHGPGGELAGAVVLQRSMVNRWLAIPVLLDVGAAKIAAEWVDKGPANGMHCCVRDADAMMPSMSRVRNTMYERVARLPYPIEWEEADPKCRWGTDADVDALVDLFWPSNLNGFPSKRILRRFMRKDVGNVIVYDAGPGVGPVGMFTVTTWTNKWLLGGGAVVRPDYREQGLSWKMLGFGVKVANEAKVGGQSFTLDSNPMSLPEDMLGEDDFKFVRLRPPRRFKGEPRLHKLWLRLLTRDNEREQARDFGRNRVDRSRRTQDAWRARSEGGDEAAQP